MERVNIRNGNRNCIIIAPHGPDDPHTGTIAQELADGLDAYAVINQGFERTNGDVDIWKDKANCNNLLHCQEDVVREEFLDPILSFHAKIRQTHSDPCYVFIIHGINFITRKVNPDIILGYGAGDPPSHSCSTWRKDAFCGLLSDKGFEVYTGKAGGQFSGWSKTNLNQLFRKWPVYYDPHVQSFQIEVSRDWRMDKTVRVGTVEILGECIEELMVLTEHDVNNMIIPIMKEF